MGSPGKRLGPVNLVNVSSCGRRLDQFLHWAFSYPFFGIKPQICGRPHRLHPRCRGLLKSHLQACPPVATHLAGLTAQWRLPYASHSVCEYFRLLLTAITSEPAADGAHSGARHLKVFISSPPRQEILPLCQEIPPAPPRSLPFAGTASDHSPTPSWRPRSLPAAMRHTSRRHILSCLRYRAVT